MANVAPIFPRISDYVAYHADKNPATVALALGDDRRSYGDLARAVDDLAKALIAAGVRKGDRVATLQAPCPDYAVAFLATASIGAIWVGLNPRYSLDELAYVVDDAKPVLMLARRRLGDRDYEGDLTALRDRCAAIRETIVFDSGSSDSFGTPMSAFLSRGASVADAELTAAREACGGLDPCLIVYTSGSSGRPKGALLHHDAIASFSVEQNRVWPVDPVRIVNYFPINHVGCVVDITIPTLAAGGTIFFLEQFDPQACLDLMQRERVTLWASVPSVFAMQLALPDFDRYDLSAVQLIVWEGAAMPEPMIRRLSQICPRLATNYSMTETTGAITVIEPTDDIDRLANSVGEPFPGVEIRLADAQGKSPPQGEPGEVLTRSRYCFRGYWERPEATADAFTPEGFFHTGDLAVQRRDGTYRIVGRLKEMFKSGGYNVYPREIEAVLEAHPDVVVAAVVSVADPLWQEVGVAYVIPSGNVTPEDLLEWCRARLANYKVPKHIRIESDLPLLPVGKIDKQTLAARARQGV